MNTLKDLQNKGNLDAAVDSAFAALDPLTKGEAQGRGPSLETCHAVRRCAEQLARDEMNGHVSTEGYSLLLPYGRSSSKIWSYGLFERHSSGTRVRCQLCSKVWTLTGGRGVLKAHIRKHPGRTPIEGMLAKPIRGSSLPAATMQAIGVIAEEYIQKLLDEEDEQENEAKSEIGQDTTINPANSASKRHKPNTQYPGSPDDAAAVTAITRNPGMVAPDPP